MTRETKGKIEKADETAASIAAEALDKMATNADGKVPSMDEAGLRALSRDIAEGRVFTDRQCQNPNDVGMVFVVAMFGGFKEQAKYATEHPDAPDAMNLIYEYIDKAGPRAINGMPMFFSARMLNRSDVVKLDTYIKEYVAITKAFTAGPVDRDDNAVSDHGPKPKG